MAIKLERVNLFGVSIGRDKPSPSSVEKKIKTKAPASPKLPKLTKAGAAKAGAIIDYELIRERLSGEKDSYLLIDDYDSLVSYIDTILTGTRYAIDTETTGLNPRRDDIVGVSLYSDKCSKAAYIPINHINPNTEIRIEKQITVEQMSTQLERLKGLNAIMFNAKFDLQVIKSHCGVDLGCWYDGMVAAHLLNENEEAFGLKALYSKYVTPNETASDNYAKLFAKTNFATIPIDIATIYAAKDAWATWCLFNFQYPHLVDNYDNDMDKVSSVFWNIEMPLVPVIADMESTGIAFSFDKQKELHDIYTAKLNDIDVKLTALIEEYREAIDSVVSLKQKGQKINVASPTQVAMLLYDIIGLTNTDRKNPRGTGEEILSQMDHPIPKMLLEYRGVNKLLTTYVDKMPGVVDAVDGRIHSNFWANGTVTGRLSSTEPNAQNIPSHESIIRTMFCAKEGHVLLSSDYSKQEMVITAHMANDDKMIEAFRAGKDIYSEIAALAFSKSYEDCLEKFPDGTTNRAGKERRGAAKAVTLGVMYGKMTHSIAKDLDISVQKAQEVYDQIMTAFPGLKRFMEESQYNARTKGYVLTIWGRKRRLVNMQLLPYTIEYLDAKVFDPLDFESGFTSQDVPEDEQHRWISKLSRCRGRYQKDKVIAGALISGIKITDNNSKIAEATRQTVNARVQGSAADMTKIAMVNLWSNKRLKELGFKLLLTVHDELIGECPEEHQEECGQIMAAEMSDVTSVLKIKLKCDVAAMKYWGEG